jgi:hypothetical protein
MPDGKLVKENLKLPNHQALENKSVYVLEQDGAVVGTRKGRGKRKSVGIQARVENDPKVLAFPPVIPEPDVGRKEVLGAVVLKKRIGRQFAVKGSTQSHPRNMEVEQGIAVRKRPVVISVFQV